MTATQDRVVLTPEQAAAADGVLGWAENPGGARRPRECVLAGLAGTGKSTIMWSVIQAIKDATGRTVQVATPTGRAADVLRRKGVEGATTVHSLIYDFRGETSDEKGRAVPIFDPKDLIAGADGNFVAVDEASMVNTQMREDLLSHGFRVIWVGDHGQLPPIGGDPGLMADPDHRLETIHRQAADNPILRLAHHVRRGGTTQGFIDQVGGDPRLRITGAAGVDRIVGYARDNMVSQVLVGYNETRMQVNAEWRKQAGFTGRLVPCDRLICLLNNRRAGLFNGSQFYVLGVDEDPEGNPDVIAVDAKDEEGIERYFRVWAPCLGRGQIANETVPDGVDLFDYAFAVTVHKAQGSEWGSVLAVEQGGRSWDMDRWRYTAYTRAKKDLTVVMGCKR